MQLRVRLFATLKEKAGADHVIVEVTALGARVGELLGDTGRQVPSLGSSLRTVIVAIHQAFALPDQPLRAGDESALFPPVSGG